MRKSFDVSGPVILLVAVLASTLVGASTASAQNGGGLDLSWNDCGAAGQVSRTFACTSNTLAANLILSAISGVDMPQLNGMETTIYVQTNQASLPAWWHLESGGCRGPSALVFTQDFTTGPFSCLDPWAGQASGSLTFTPQFNYAVIQAAGAIPGSTSIMGTEEYYVAKIRILGDKSVGDGSCAGCTAGACITAGSVKLTQPAGAPGGNVTLTHPILRQYVTFQSGGTLSGACPPVATKPSTWGSVKSLYR